MKNLTRILSGFSLLLVLAFSARSQDVFKVAPIGIGTTAPAQALDVNGSVRFLYALMPNGNAGLNGNVLLSGGASPAFPTWLANGTSGQVLTSTGIGVVYAAAGYWNLTGNSGTNPSINFIGTTNDFPLVFLTDGSTITSSTYAGQIDPQYETSGTVLKGNTYMGGGSPNEANFALIGGGNNDAGNYNVGVGDGVLGQNTTGTGNVALGGYFTLILNTTGNYNVAFDRAMESNYAGNGSVGAGFDALYSQSATASYNIGIGYEAGYIYANAGSGNASSYPSGIGNFNSAIGYEALYIGTSTNDAVSNTGVGNYVLYTTTGKQNTAVGDSALFTNISGNFNAALGFGANVSGAAYTNATAIGYTAVAKASNSITLGNTSVAYSAVNGAGLYLPGYNSAGSFYYTSAASGLVASLAPGTSGYMLQSNGAGAAPTWASVTPTSGTVTNITGTLPIVVSGTWIIGIQGTNATEGGVLYSAGPATSALFTPTGTAGTFLTSNGTGVPTWANAYWNLTGNAGTNPAVNFVGTINDEPLFIHSSVYAGQIDPGSPFNGNTNLGAAAGHLDAGTYNVALGGDANVGELGANTSGTGNVAVSGYGGLKANSTGNYNISFGRALLNNSTGSGNIGLGFQVLQSTTAASYNIAIGYQAGYGGASLGNFNSIIGYETMGDNGGGTNYHASNVALGSYAMFATTGSRNTAVGDSALRSVTTGTNNAALGYFANVSLATATNATAIGYSATATTANTVILGGTGANAVSVGIGTATPARTLEVGGTANTIRVDGLASGGTFNTQISASKGNVVYVNNANGDLYSLPNTGFVTGDVLTLNTNGVPSWGPSVASSITKYSILPGSGSSVVIGGGFTNSVVGSSDVTLDIQGTSGGIFYGTGSGTPAAFSAAGATNQVLLSGGAGAPTWASAISLLTTYGIAKGSGSSVVVGNGPNQVVGASPGVTIDVQGTAGGIFYGTGISSPAVFTSAGITGQILTSNGTTAIFEPNGYWSLTGNSGTIPGISHIGTNDNKQLRITLDANSVNWPGGYAGSIDPQVVGATTYGNVYLGAYNWNNGVNGAGNIDQGTYNVALGFGCLGSVTSGAYNVALGAHDNAHNTTGSDNVTIGYGEVWTANSTGLTGLGTNPNLPAGPGSYTTFIGAYVLNGSSAGLYNTALGYASMYSSTAGQSNTALGSNALYSATASHNTAVGDSALYTNTGGGNNTALGYKSGVATAALTNTTAIGYQAVAPVSNSVTFGNSSVSSLYLPGYNTIGSLYYTSAGSGLISSLTPGTSGYELESNGPGNVPTWASVSPSSGTVTNVTGTAPIVVSGTWTIGIQGTGANAGGVLYSTGAGNSAAFMPTGLSGQFLLSNGTSAPYWGAFPGSSWGLSGNAGTTSANFVGTTDAHRLEFGVFNSSSAGPGYSGSIDMGVVTNSTGTNGYGNTYLGPGSTNTNGNFGPGNNDIGVYNVGIGRGTMADVQNNSVIGNVGIGTLALNGASGAYSYDVAIGYTAAISTTTATGDITIQGNPHGTNATTSGSYDIAIGLGSGTGSTPFYNTAVGFDALNVNSTAASGTAIGARALALNTTGSRNTASGDSALYTNTTGANNTALGYQANVSTAALTNAIALGYKATATASNSIILGSTASPVSLYLPSYNTIGSLFYTSAASGLVGQTGAGTSGYLLQSNGPGAAPAWANVTIGGSGTVTTVTGTPPMYITGTWNVNIQGNNPNTDKGGVLYSTGAGTAAVFTPTPTAAGMLLISGTPPSSGPTWATWASLTPTPVWNFTGNTSNLSYGNYFVGTLAQGSNNFPMTFKALSQAFVTSGILDNVNGNVYFGGQLNSSYPGGENTVLNGATHNVGIGNGALGVPNTAGSAMIETAGGDPGVTNNVFIGYGCGLWTLQANSTAIGTTSQRNISGNPAGTVGGPNTNLGNFCFRSSAGSTGFTALGNHNTAIGNEAMYDETTASYNTVIGDLAMSGSSNGASTYFYNTSLGYHSLFGITTGNDNTAIGDLAASGRTTGTFGVAAGYQALTANTTSTSNVALGSNALLTVVTGASNTAIGAGALDLTTVSHNTAIGDSVLYSNTTGTYNTGVGYRALTTTAATGATGGNTTGTYNTGLGYNADVSSNTLINTTTLGANAYASTSNELILGEINGINGATANTNVSIGTNAPQSDAGLAIAIGHFETQGQLAAGNITATVANAGTGATAIITTGGPGATDIGGEITLTTGTGAWAAGTQATVVFATPYIYSPIVSLTPANGAAAAAMSANQVYASSTPNSFSINFGAAASSSTSYKFNYSIIETPGTSPTYQSSYTELCQVPITLTNSQATATPTGYQQMISVNSSLYTNENAALNNIVFTDAAPVGGVTQGNVLNAWIESGATSSSNPTVYWVNLGNDQVPASGTLTIYMNMVSTNIMSASGPTGEAPQLSGTYGQYDNGSLVFNNYWNFPGPSIPSGLTFTPGADGSIVYSSGAKMTLSTPAWGTYLTTSSTVTPPIVVESDMAQNVTASAAALVALVASSSSTLANGAKTYAGYDETSVSTEFEFVSTYNNGGTNFPWTVDLVSSTPLNNTNFNIWSLGVNSSGNLGFADINYTNDLTVLSGTSPNAQALGNFYIGLQTTQQNASFYWLRTRTYPPSGVNPTPSFGSQTCP